MPGEMEHLSIVISTMFKDTGTKAASRAVKGLSDEIDSVGDRAQRSASRTRMAYASVAKTMRETRAEAKKGAEFKVGANVSALAGVRRVFQGLRQDAQRGATFEVRGDASGLRDVQGTFSAIRRDAANGAVFRTRLDQSGMNGVRESFSRIRQDAANGATFRVRADQQGLSGIRGSFSGIRQDASNGAAFRVRGVLSGISGIPSVLASIRSDAANGATFRVHAEATGIPGVTGALGMLDQRASTMDAKWGNSVHIHTDATNVEGVMAELSRLGIEATRLDNNKIDIPIDANSENARRQLEQIRLVAQSLSNQNARIRVDADAAAARIRLAEIERQMNDLNGQTARVGVTTFGAAGVSELAGKIRALSTVLAVASTPALVSMLATIPAVASAAAAGVGALAVGIGSGLVGGAMAGAGAMGVLGASMALVGGPISALVGKLTDYHSGLESSGAASQAAASAAQQYGDANRAVDQAVVKRGQTEQDVAQSVADAWQSYQRSQEATGQTAVQVAQQTSDAWQAYQDTIADTGRTTQQVAQQTSDAWDQYVATREKVGDTEESASRASADAADQLKSARSTLRSSMAELVATQREYNEVLKDEPRNQQYSLLDLADAYDRASDNQRAYNEAVKEYGPNSEEATDAQRAMIRSNFDLQRQQEQTNEAHKQGSQELRDAYGNLVSAQNDRLGAAEGVAKAEQNADRVARDGAKQILEARKAESAQYQSYLRTQQQGAQQIQDAKKAEAQALEAYRRTEAQGQQQMAAARQSEADQYQAWQRSKEQGDRQLQESQDAVNQAVLAASRAAEAMGAAQSKAAGDAVVLTAAQQALYDRFMAFKADAAGAFAPAMDSAALLGVRVLDLADNYLPALGAASYAAMGELGRGFDQFASKLQQPIPATAIQTILDYVPEATYLASSAAGDLGIALVTALSLAAPYGMDLLRIVGGLLSTFEGWMTSTEGVAATDAAFAGLYDRAGQLWGIVSDLGVGLYGLGQALEDSGLVDMAMGGLGAMAQNFRDATSSSSGLSGNMERLTPVLESAAGIAGVLYDEFFLLADAVLAATNPATGNSTLLELMDSLKAVVPIVGDVLLTTFEELAPAISRNIGPISEFIGNFLGSSDVLVGVLDSLGGMAEKFNDLPAPVKDAAHELAAMAAVASVLGVGPMSLLQVGAYASIIGANMVSMAPAIATAATALWGYASAAAAALLPFAGLAALGLIAIGVAVTFDWGGAADAYSRAREEGDHIGLALGEALDAGLRTVPVLGWIWEKFNEFDAKLKGDWAGIVGDWAFKAFGFEPPKITLLDALGNQLAKLLPGGEWDGIFSAWFDRSWAALKPPEVSVLDVLMGNGEASENPLLNSLMTAWEGVTGWLGGLVPEVNLMGVLLGGAGEENPLLTKLTTAWTGVTEWLAGLVPERSLMDVLMGAAEGVDNWLLTPLVTAWTGVTEWLASLVPEVSILDVLMGRGGAGENPLLAPLLTAWTGVTEWIAGLLPEVSILDVLMGRGEAGENPILATVTAWWTGLTGWLAGLVPEVSLLDVVMGRGEAGENPILATVMGWWTGFTAWLTPTLVTLGTLFTTGWAYVSTATATALTGVWTFVQGWWTTLSGWFTTGLQAVGTIFLAGWTFVSSTTSSVFGAVMDFLSGWWATGKALFFSGVEAVKSGIGAGWDWVSSTTSSVYDAIASFLSGWWDSTTGLFSSSVETVKSGIGAGWDWVSSTTSSAYDAIASFLSDWWSSTQSLFSSSLDLVMSGVGSAWDWVSSTTSSVFGAIGSFFGDWWSGTISFFSSSLDSIMQGVGSAWDWVGEKTNSAYAYVRDTVVDLFTDAKDRAISIAGSLKDGVLNVFDALPDAVHGIFTAVGENIWKPVEWAEGKLKEVWNRIIDGVSSVLEAIGDPGGLAGKLQGAKFASGGVAGGPVQTFAEGGVAGAPVRAFASGGIGTSAPNGRLHYWNEQQGGEVFAAERGPKNKQIGYLQHGASWFDHSVVPNDALRPASAETPREHRDSRPRHPSKGSGAGLVPRGTDVGSGDGLYPTMWSYIPEVKSFGDDTVGKFGGTHNTYAEHPIGYAQPYYRERSIDFWGPGGRGDPVGTDRGNAIADHAVSTLGGNLNWLIWAGQMLTAGGWGPDTSGFSHYDHVHVTAFADAPTVNGGGGGGIGGWIQSKASQLWDEYVAPLYSNLDFGPHVLAKGAADLVKQSGNNIKTWVMSSLPGGGAGGGPGTGFEGGGDAAANRELGKKMNEAMGWGGQWSSLDALWTKESGWDNKADNQNSDAYGIPQGMMGPGGHTPPPGYMPPDSDPAVQIDWGLGYIARQHGDPNGAWAHSQQMGWYKQGGVIPGSPGTPFPAVLHGQERVLSASNNRAFEGLARSITLWSSRGAGRGSGGSNLEGGSAGTDVLAAKLDKLIERFDAMDEHLDRISLSPRAEAGVGRAASQAVKSYAKTPAFGDDVESHASYRNGPRARAAGRS